MNRNKTNKTESKTLGNARKNLGGRFGLFAGTKVSAGKRFPIKGQPTSIHLAMTASVNHRDLMRDLKERDVTPVNDEQIPDGANP